MMQFDAIDMAISVLLSITGTAVAVMAYVRNRRKDEHDEGATKGVMASDIGYIKAGVDDLKRENRETRVVVQSLSERVTRCEESAKQAHKRIDELKKEGEGK